MQMYALVLVATANSRHPPTDGASYMAALKGLLPSWVGRWVWRGR